MNVGSRISRIHVGCHVGERMGSLQSCREEKIMRAATRKSRIPYPVYEHASVFAGIPSRSTGLREHTASNNGANILLNNKRPGDTHHTSAFRHLDIPHSPQV